MVPLSWASVAISLSLLCCSISISAMPQAPRASVDQSCFMRGATTQVWAAGASSPTATFTVGSINFGLESRNGAGVAERGRPFPPALLEVGSKARVETFLRIAFPGLYKFYVSSSDPSTFSLAPVNGRPLNPESAVNFPEGDLDVLVTEYRMLTPGLYDMMIDFTKEKAGTVPQLKLEWEYSGSQAATPSATGRRISRGAIWRQQMYVHNCPDSLLAEPRMRPQTKPVAVPGSMVPNPMASVPSFPFAAFAQLSRLQAAATAARPAPVQQADAGIDPAVLAAMPVLPPPLPILEDPAVTGLEIPPVGMAYSGAMPDPVLVPQGAYGTVPTPSGIQSGSYGGSVISPLPRPLFGRRLSSMESTPMQTDGPNPLPNRLPMRPSEIFAASVRDHPVTAANPDPLAGTALLSFLAVSQPTLRSGIAVPGSANVAIPAETSPDHNTMGEAMAHSSVAASAPSPIAGTDVPMPAVAPGLVETHASVPMPGHGMVSVRNPIAPTVPISISTTRPVPSTYQLASTMVGALPRSMYMPGQGNPAAAMQGPRALPFTQFSGSVAAETVTLPHLPWVASTPSALPQRMEPRRHSANASQRPVNGSDVGLGDFMTWSAPYPSAGLGTPLPIVEEQPAPAVVGEPVGITTVPMPQPVPGDPELVPVTGGVIGEPMTQGSDAPVPGPIPDPAQIVAMPAMEPVPTEVVGEPIAIASSPATMAVPGGDSATVVALEPVSAVQATFGNPMTSAIANPSIPADALTPAIPVDALTPAVPADAQPAIPADALTPAVPADAPTPAVAPELGGVPPEALIPAIPADALTPAVSPELVSAEPVPALAPAGEPAPVVALGPVFLRNPEPVPEPMPVPAVEPVPSTVAEVPMFMPVPLPADTTPAPAGEPVPVIGDPAVLLAGGPVVVPAEPVPSTVAEVPMSMPVPLPADATPVGEPVPIIGDPAKLPMGEPVLSAASEPLSVAAGTSALPSTDPAVLVTPLASAPAEQLTAVVLEPVSASFIAPTQVTGPLPVQAIPVPLTPTLDAALLAPLAHTSTVGEPVARVAGEGGVINQAMIVAQAPGADAGQPKLEAVRAMVESKAEEGEHKEKWEENELNPAFDIARAGGAGSYGSYGEKGAYFAVHSSPHYFPIKPEEIQPIGGGNRRHLLSNPRLSLRANPLEAAIDATVDDANNFRPVAMNTFVTEETFKGVGGKPSHKRVTMISVVEQEEQAPQANTVPDFAVDDDLFTGKNLNREVGGEDDGEQEDDGDVKDMVSTSHEAHFNTMSIRPVLETPQPIPSGSWLTKISKGLQADSAHPSPSDALGGATQSGNTTVSPRRPAQSIAGALFERALAWLSKQTGARAPESTVAAEAPSAQEEAARASAEDKAWKAYVNHQVWAGLFNEPSVLQHIQAPEEDTHDAALAHAHRLGAQWDEGDVEDDEVLMDNVLLTPLPTRPAPKAYLKRLFHGMPHGDELPSLEVPEHVKQARAPQAVSKRSQDFALHFLGMPHQNYFAASKVSGSKAVAGQVQKKAGVDMATSAVKAIDFNVPEWLGDRLHSLLPPKPAPT